MPAGKATVSVSFTKINTSYKDCPKDDTCPIWTYTDASTTARYHDGVHYCVQNGLMTGYGDKLFGPDWETSRAMVAVILWRLEGSPVVNYALQFDDVAGDAWYADAVRWAVPEGLAAGYGNGSFGPNDTITREQLAAMLYRYEQYKGGGLTGDWAFPLDFSDADQVSDWAYEAMCWMTMHGVIEGVSDKTLAPKETATRAQTAAVIMQFTEKVK